MGTTNLDTLNLSGGLTASGQVNANSLVTSPGGIVVAGGATFQNTVSFTGSPPQTVRIASAINATATATAAQVATGYITSTSAAAVTITLPTGTLLGAQMSAVPGTMLDLVVDNTNGANTVTMAVAVNGIKSDAATTTAASFGQMTVASGATGMGVFRLIFASPSAYSFTRVA